ncbi:MAG: Eco57I restriction-modification methylase domain-containing protein [Ignavibacteriales bacterium]|nr:MAG: Eco57I restriction-modification methylase domain-containing protein [Ignavibacteriales bacterium]
MIELNLIQLKKSINKSYLKIKPVRDDFNKFKNELQKLLSLINDRESEEHNKNFVRDFLLNTFYARKYVNTKGRTDLTIHIDKTGSSFAGVLIEVKSPVNKTDMISESNLNCKAMHEVILYYLRERIEHKNDEIKSVIITNVNKWFIFKADQFEKYFYKSSLKDEYLKWRDDKKVTKLNDHFYNEIVSDYLVKTDVQIECVYFDLRNYKSRLIKAGKENEKELIPLFKKFSPQEILKESFANDSNTLNKQFYIELLHIIGLEEFKEGSKKKIGRKKEKERDNGSLIENTIRMLESKNIDDLSLYGDSKEIQLFNIALELNIIWINRILFLKLLEAQLVNYHNGNTAYKFLDPKIINQYDDLYELFHEVLAIKPGDRNKDLIPAFNNLPYLNSSLFDQGDLEKKTIDISNLKDRYKLRYHPNTVFNKEVIAGGELHTLQYLLRFLDAYDFASEGGEEIREERKTIINASVLGLIFEKINGYKEGSFYTPGFITMYMARETLRRAVTQKFNETKNTAYKDYDELKRNMDVSFEGRKEANKIINSIKICDPAVGSGHFLVSCLNEIIAIKADLKILSYIDGRQVQNYNIEIENDELIITNEETDELFDYHLNPSGKEITSLQDLQETLFHEKETIIENCLFGVDINPNSVNICRLRLWIELLKNSYYKNDNSSSTLNGKGKRLSLITLPNIDINIKQGNSLISRFKIDEDIFTPADKSVLEVYKLSVALYKNTQDKSERRELKDTIEKTKERFRGIAVDPLIKEREQMDKLTAQLHKLNVDNPLFKHEDSKEKEVELEKKKNNLNEKITRLSKEIETKAEEFRKIYSDAFEWRFEFPEVLDGEGNYKGFDVVIGNPPYIFGGNEGISTTEKKYFKEIYYSGQGKVNLFTLFVERSASILFTKGKVCLIIPNTFLRVTSYHHTRKFLLDNYKFQQVTDFGVNVFDDAITTAIVILFSNEKPEGNERTEIRFEMIKTNDISQDEFISRNYVIALSMDDKNEEIFKKLSIHSIQLGSIAKELIFGVVITKNQREIVSDKKIKGWKPFLEGRDIGSYYIKPINKYLNYNQELLHRARTKEIFEASEKLLIQRITGGHKPLKAAYDSKKTYNKESINNLILKQDCEYNIKYILALLNSKLINWFYVNRFTNESKLTVNLSKEYLSQIPIKEASKKLQGVFVELVDTILTAKTKNYTSDTTALEKEIDEMVYQLYGITEEEIRIIEGTFNH